MSQGALLPMLPFISSFHVSLFAFGTQVTLFKLLQDKTIPNNTFPHAISLWVQLLLELHKQSTR